MFFCQLDADKGSLSFAKNGGELRLAFTDLPTNVELFPVVVFYSLNPGEKVKPAASVALLPYAS